MIGNREKGNVRPESSGQLIVMKDKDQNNLIKRISCDRRLKNE
ncbi:MAG: hypothetical protein RJA81_1956 [Planctomycetota bacterium]|jgi:hypothetical protein